MGYLVSHNLYRCKIDRLGNDNGPEIWAFQKPCKIRNLTCILALDMISKKV